MTKKLKKAPAPRLNKMAGQYDGAELRPYNGRPGAMDAFDKPSLVNGQLVKHKPMSYMTSAVSTPFYTAS